MDENLIDVLDSKLAEIEDDENGFKLLSRDELNRMLDKIMDISCVL